MNIALSFGFICSSYNKQLLYTKKKYVFKTSSKQSFIKYNFVTLALSFIEFFFSNFLRLYFELNVYAFLIAGGTVFLMRFLLNKYFVFGSKNENKKLKKDYCYLFLFPTPFVVSENRL